MNGAEPLRLLTIAGSDSGGGAGLQADLKTFAAHGSFGMSVVTSVTAQNTLGVWSRFDLAPDLVVAQLDAVLTDLPPAAIKLGMLGSAEVVAAVAGRLRSLAGTVPVIVDPVMIAGSGDPLLDPEAVELLISEIFPLATLVTPNLPEARALAGRDAPAATLAAKLSSHAPMLVKGGHADGADVEDILAVEGRLHRFSNPRLRAERVHGAGCTLAAAAAVYLARGTSLPAAAARAIAYVQRAIAGSRRLGAGSWVLLHPDELEAA